MSASSLHRESTDSLIYHFQLFLSIIAVSLLSSTGTTYNNYDKCKNQKCYVGMAPCQKLLIQEGLIPVY